MYAADYDDGLLLGLEEDKQKAPGWAEALSAYGLYSSQLICPSDGQYRFDSGRIDYKNNCFAEFGASYEYNYLSGVVKFPAHTASPDASIMTLASEFQPFHRGHDFALGKFSSSSMMVMLRAYCGAEDTSIAGRTTAKYS